MLKLYRTAQNSAYRLLDAIEASIHGVVCRTANSIKVLLKRTCTCTCILILVITELFRKVGMAVPKRAGTRVGRLVGWSVTDVHVTEHPLLHDFDAGP